MGKKKFFAAAFAAFVLWAIVILQTVLTRWYVSQTAFEQAFAKSDIMKASTLRRQRQMCIRDRCIGAANNGGQTFSSVWWRRSNEQQFR